ncbi:unnamed protein product, partial [Notodromas monacha]
MLIKEYRIPLPLTVSEYKIAQLYMIAKKSRDESKGAGSGVEIMVNEPYTDGPGPNGTGQYTRKIYHIGSHLPGWLKSLMPKSALIVEEEAWNAYPYTKTKYKCPFVERFTLEIETYYFNDDGSQENVFNLSRSELRERAVGSRNLEEDVLTARMESIAHDSDQGSDASDEFYDAKDEFSETLSLTKWNSMELVPDGDNVQCSGPSCPKREGYVLQGSPIVGREELTAKYERQISSRSADSYLSHGVSPVPPNCSTVCLVLVFHGGSVLDVSAEMSSKKSDVTTFRGAFESVMRQHYPCLVGRVVVQLVPCPAMCSEALGLFSSLSPYSFDVSPTASDGNVSITRDAIPIGAVPLFMTNSPEYHDAVSRVISRANSVYHEFLRSEEGVGFSGQVVIVGDSAGAIFAYDALCGHDRPEKRLSSESIDKDGLHEQQHSKVHANVSWYYNVLESVSESEAWEPGRKPSCQKSFSDIPTLSGCGVGDGDGHHAPLKAFLSAPAPRSYSISSSCDSQAGQLDFEVSSFFLMGSPLSIILAFRRIQNSEDRNGMPPRPACGQIYNLFHPANPVASRIEPLLATRFAQLPPIPIPRYSKYPMGDGTPTIL